MNFKRGDTVKVITGASKGKTGKVLKVARPQERIVVEGINLRKKHTRPRKQGQKGQMIEFPAPLHLSNVMLVCPKCNKTTRISVTLQGEKKKRVCKRCKGVID
ncbi:50S ribosomal protein L24 [Candidatus Uhrbacteria bacterium]|nr:50S ribosomal protein L24 [Candidatus Uhrbacteria bacterium]